MSYIASPLAGCIVNRFGCRATIIVGGLLCITGLVLTSFAPNIYVIFLTYSGIMGFGASCIFMASFLVIPKYFYKRRSLATGIVACGTGLGVLTVVPVLQVLLDSVGLRDTYRVLSSLFLIVILLGCSFNPVVKGDHQENEQEVLAQHDGNEDERPHKMIDFTVWRIPAFTVITLSITIGFFGHIIPRIHLVSFRNFLRRTMD